MKKLFVLALAVMMVLSLTAVSMAATTVGGELNFFYKSNGTTNVKSTESNAKITFKADLSDTLGAYAEIKAANAGIAPVMADYYGTAKFAAGTLKVGSYEYKFIGDVDILSTTLPCQNIKGDATIEFAPELGEGITASVIYNLAKGNATLLAEGVYGLKVGYKTDAFGVEVGMANQDTNNNATVLNASYTLDALKLFTNYEDTKIGGVSLQSNIIGAIYTADAIFGRLEYDLKDNAGNNNYAVAGGYTKDGVTYALIQSKVVGADITTLKMKVVF